MTHDFTEIGYLLFLAIGAGMWLFGRWRPGLIAPLENVMQRAMRKRTARLGLLTLWWWLGWHFLADGVTWGQM